MENQTQLLYEAMDKIDKMISDVREGLIGILNDYKNEEVCGVRNEIWLKELGVEIDYAYFFRNESILEYISSFANKFYVRECEYIILGTMNTLFNSYYSYINKNMIMYEFYPYSKSVMEVAIIEIIGSTVRQLKKKATFEKDLGDGTEDPFIELDITVYLLKYIVAHANLDVQVDILVRNAI